MSFRHLHHWQEKRTSARMKKPTITKLFLLLKLSLLTAPLPLKASHQKIRQLDRRVLQLSSCQPQSNKRRLQERKLLKELQELPPMLPQKRRGHQARKMKSMTRLDFRLHFKIKELLDHKMCDYEIQPDCTILLFDRLKSGPVTNQTKF